MARSAASRTSSTPTGPTLASRRAAPRSSRSSPPSTRVNTNTGGPLLIALQRRHRPHRHVHCRACRARGVPLLPPEEAAAHLQSDRGAHAHSRRAPRHGADQGPAAVLLPRALRGDRAATTRSTARRPRCAPSPSSRCRPPTGRRPSVLAAASKIDIVPYQRDRRRQASHVGPDSDERLVVVSSSGGRDRGAAATAAAAQQRQPLEQVALVERHEYAPRGDDTAAKGAAAAAANRRDPRDSQPRRRPPVVQRRLGGARVELARRQRRRRRRRCSNRRSLEATVKGAGTEWEQACLLGHLTQEVKQKKKWKKKKKKKKKNRCGLRA
jgi:hypothetical protein